MQHEVMSYPCPVLDVSVIMMLSLGMLDKTTLDRKGCMMAVKPDFGDTESVGKMDTSSTFDICPAHPCDGRQTN
jgi:hypothetical protein